MPKKGSKEQLAKDIEDQDEAKVYSAVEKGGVGQDIEIIDKDGRKLKVKAKKIDPATVVDDRDSYN